MLSTKKQTAEQAELRRDVRNQGLAIVKIDYSDSRAPAHWCLSRVRDGSRLSKAYTCESDCWLAVPAILSEMALARETAQREEQERLERYRAAAAEKRINSAKLPPELMGIDLDSFPESKARAVAADYVATFEDKLKATKNSLIFVGPGLEKLRLSAAILEEVTRRGFSGRWMGIVDVEFALDCGGISAIVNPDLLVFASFESAEALRSVLRLRKDKPSIVSVSVSIDRLKDLVFGIYPDDGLGLESWTQMERRAEIVIFAKEEK